LQGRLLRFITLCLLKGNRGQDILRFDIIDAFNHAQSLVLLLLLREELLVEFNLGLFHLLDAFEELTTSNFEDMTSLRHAGGRCQALTPNDHILIAEKLTDIERDQFECTVHFGFSQ